MHAELLIKFLNYILVLPIAVAVAIVMIFFFIAILLYRCVLASRYKILYYVIIRVRMIIVISLILSKRQ